jgi:hypothetical protein
MTLDLPPTVGNKQISPIAVFYCDTRSFFLISLFLSRTRFRSPKIEARFVEQLAFSALMLAAQQVNKNLLICFVSYIYSLIFFMSVCSNRPQIEARFV